MTTSTSSSSCERTGELIQDVTLPAVVFLWLVVAIRLAGTARGGSARVAVILVLTATAATVNLRFVGDSIDELTEVVGLQVFVRACVAVMVVATAAHIVGSLVQARPSPRWAVRVSSGAILVSLGLMSYFFGATGAERTGVLDITSASSEPAALSYWLSYLVPFGGFLLCVAVLALGDARRPTPWTRGRTGLTLFGIAALVGVIYVVVKVVAVLMAADSPFVLRHEARVGGVISLVATALAAAGAATWTDVRLYDRYLLARLWTAHRLFTRDHAGPRPPWSALTVTERLDRRVVEIGEAVTRHQGRRVQTVPYLPDGPPSRDPAELLRQLVEARRSAASGSLDR